MLAVGFVVGIVMSLTQILTSIQDSSFSTVPRLAAFLAALLLAMPWMLAKLIAYTTRCSATWAIRPLRPMTLGLPLSTLYAFLLVLARVAGLITFLPVPGFRNAPDTVRVVLALAITFALFPVWPALPNVNPTIGQLAAWAFCEAGFGLVGGFGRRVSDRRLPSRRAGGRIPGRLRIRVHHRSHQPGRFGASCRSWPRCRPDCCSLPTGLDHQLIRVLAASFEKFPAGSWAPASASLDGIVRLGGEMFSTGLRLGLPVVALLLLIDFALALLGRVQQQLQLLSLAFPAKMAAALVLLAVLAPVVPKMFGAAAEHTLAALWRSLG